MSSLIAATSPMRQNITLCYDSQCAFCQKSMDWFERRDKHGRLNIKPLEQASDSVVLTDSNGTWTESSAVLRTIEHLGGFWRLARILRIIPPFIRNAAYRIVARRRRRASIAAQEAQNTGG